MKRKGFTLIDLIILVIVFVVVFIVFLPNTENVTHLTNEQIAIGNLRTVVGSQTAFRHYEGGYASKWDELRDDLLLAGKPAYLDIDLSGLVFGYNYTLTGAGDSLTGSNGTTVYTDFTCTAVPIQYFRGSYRSFFVDSSGVIRFQYGKPATKDSLPI